MIKEEQNLSVCGILYVGSPPTRFPCEPGWCGDGRHSLHPKIAPLMFPFLGTQQFDQFQIRASRLSNQTCSENLQVSTTPRRE